MIKRMAIVSLLVLITIPVLFSQGSRICLLPFKTSYQLNKNKNNYHALIADICDDISPCAMEKETTWYAMPAGTLSAQQVKYYDYLLKKNDSSMLVMGNLTKVKNGIFIRSYLYDGKKKAITYETNEFADSEKEFPEKVKAIFSRFLLVISNKMPSVSEFKASQGSDEKQIALSWRCSSVCGNYFVYRSKSKNAQYELIGKENKDTYQDTDAEEGVKYFYKIVPEKNGIYGESAYAWGYIKPKNPQVIDPDDILNNKSMGWENPLTDTEKTKQDSHKKLMEKFYEGWLTMSFIILVGKSYIKKGELLIYRDFSHYSLDRAHKTAYFSKPGMTVKFVSNRLFRFIRNMDEQKIPEMDLIPRLVKNGILFCIRSGETEITGTDGTVRFVPAYEAAGFFTEYCRDYKNWRSNTLIFGSSDKELDKRIKDAKKKGY